MWIIKDHTHKSLKSFSDKGYCHFSCSAARKCFGFLPVKKDCLESEEHGTTNGLASWRPRHHQTNSTFTTNMYLKSLGWYLLVLTVLFCRKIALGLAVSILGHTGTLQRTFWISDPMHVFLAMEREQVLSRVRYEPKPQVLVQADQGLQSNSFLTETVSKIRNANF